MTDTQRTFLEAIRAACHANGVRHFDFSVENWGPMWQLWFVYVNNVNIRLDIEHLQNSDLEVLIGHKLLFKTLDFSEQDLDYPLEISRSRYQLA